MYRSQGALGEYFAAQGMGEYFAAKGMGEYFSGTGGALVDWAKQEEQEHGIGEYFSGTGEYFAQNGLGDIYQAKTMQSLPYLAGGAFIGALIAGAMKKNAWIGGGLGLIAGLFVGRATASDASTML